MIKYQYAKTYKSTIETAETDSIAYYNLLDQLEKNFELDTNSTIIQALVFADELVETQYILPSNFFPFLQQLLTDIYALLVIDIPKDKIISQRISIQDSGEELLEDLEIILSLQEAWTKIKISLQGKFPEYGTPVINLGNDILIHFLRPNLIFQKEITEIRQGEAIDKVPVSRGVVVKEEKIVGEHTKITPEIYRKIISLSKERARQANIKGGLRTSLPLIGDPLIFLGQLLLIAIIYFSFIFFLLIHKREIVYDPKMMTLIGIIFTLECLLAFLFISNAKFSEYSIPVTIAAMMLTILFDGKIAFAGICSLSILIGTQLGGNMYFVISSVFVSSFAIHSVRKLRRRSQVFGSILYIAFGYLISIFITELLQFSSISTIFDHLLYGGINSLLAPFITYGIIGLVKTIFGITTDLALLELTDFNHPLLKLLSKNATGTFTHSVTVGNLSEAAADAIGANALLARVGSYYHDIGKCTKPEYFIENQSFDHNKHDNMNPNLSALVIINHVKEGNRLAKEYKLPKVIADFIPTHHGTTNVEYFYKKAVSQSSKDEEVNISDFQYPGPRPTTKETGIVMICESIEAALKSIDNPTLSKIEKMIDLIIDGRLKEGQLDLCPLTLADLDKIKGDIKENTGILPIIKGIYHLRVEYPDQEEKISKKSPKYKK